MSHETCTCVRQPGHTWDAACPRHGTTQTPAECPQVAGGPRARARVGRLLDRLQPAHVMLLTVYALIGFQLAVGLTRWHDVVVSAVIVGFAASTFVRASLDLRLHRRERDAARLLLEAAKISAARFPGYVKDVDDER